MYEAIVLLMLAGNLVVLAAVAYRLRANRDEIATLRGLMGTLLQMYNRDAKALAEVLRTPPQHHVTLPLQIFLRAYRRLQEKEAASGAGSKVALPAPQFSTRELKSIVEIMAEQEAAVSGAPDSEVNI